MGVFLFTYCVGVYLLRWCLLTVRCTDWNFEGSNDNTTWVVLKEHKNDEAIQKVNHATAAWPVDLPEVDEGGGGATGFRFFRIFHTGTSRNTTTATYLATAARRRVGPVFELWLDCDCTSVIFTVICC
jgi:hypothetical protein